MKVLIDADGCPVVDITLRLCREFGLPCLIFCDTAHEFHRDGAETYVFDKGADSVDFAIANRLSPGDLVITQDYGLASMCLGRKEKSCTRTAGNTRPIISMRCFSNGTNPGNTVLPADG